MKVFSLPEELAAPQPDYSNFDMKALEATEAAHREKVREWLLAKGYSGDRTGGVLSEPHADGAALYMLGHAGRKSILVHLPYGDAWHSPNVEHLPLREVIARIDRGARLAELFAAPAADDVSGPRP